MPAQQRVLTADEKRQAAETAFMRVDVNGNGQADCLEFYQALMILRPDLAYDDAMVVFSIIDANGNGNVSKQEFVDHYMANY